MTLLTIPKELIKTIVLELSDVSKLMLFMSCKFLSPLKKDKEPVIYSLRSAIKEDNLNLVEYFHETLHYPLETVEDIDLGYYINCQWFESIRLENKEITKYFKDKGMGWDTTCGDIVGGSSLDYLQYYVEIGLEVNDDTLRAAVEDNKYNNVVYLTSLGIKVTSWQVGFAVGNGNLDMVKHLIKCGALDEIKHETSLLPQSNSRVNPYNGTDDEILACIRYLKARYYTSTYHEEIVEMIQANKVKCVMFVCDEYINIQSMMSEVVKNVTLLKYFLKRGCKLETVVESNIS